MSMSRKVEDKVGKTSRFHIIKNRFGVDGITFPSKMDTELGKIDIYKSTSKQGVQHKKKMDNSEEFLRKTLKKVLQNTPKRSGRVLNNLIFILEQNRLKIKRSFSKFQLSDNFVDKYKRKKGIHLGSMVLVN